MCQHKSHILEDSDSRVADQYTLGQSDCSIFKSVGSQGEIGHVT